LNRLAKDRKPAVMINFLEKMKKIAHKWGMLQKAKFAKKKQKKIIRKIWSSCCRS